mmetsp:Transcript_29395/g.53939  ORF Transcript_29395/g.53939 Transcript_29395/m.53939 type:complete len:108 (+) Transcript_29395:1718-2041(+)
MTVQASSSAEPKIWMRLPEDLVTNWKVEVIQKIDKTKSDNRRYFVDSDSHNNYLDLTKSACKSAFDDRSDKKRSNRAQDIFLKPKEFNSGLTSLLGTSLILFLGMRS